MASHTLDSAALELNLRKMLAESKLVRATLFRFDDLIPNDYNEFVFYVMPGISLLCFITIIVLVIGFKKGRLLGPPQRLLILIGILDFCTTGSPAFTHFTLMALGKNRGYIEYNLCHILVFMNTSVPNFLHGISVWTKTLLAFQRCFISVRPFFVRMYFNKKFYIIYFAVIIIVAFAIETKSLFTTNFERRKWMQEPDSTGKIEIMDACAWSFKDKSTAYAQLIWENVTAVAIASFYCILPVFVLIACDVILVHTLIRQKNVRKLLATRQALPPIYKVTILITILSFSFSFQELSRAVFLFLIAFRYKYAPTTENMMMESSIISSIITAICRPLDILLYAAASEKFRSVFKCR